MIRSPLFIGLVLLAARCETPAHIDLTVTNLSSEEFWVERVSAPEFAYTPRVGIMTPYGRSAKTSLDAVSRQPFAVEVVVRDRPPVEVVVPRLPSTGDGDITLVVVYSRSGRWTAHWEIQTSPDAEPRFVPNEGDSNFRQHRELLIAARSGATDKVRALLAANAPVLWDTTPGDPLTAAALGGHPKTVAALLDAKLEEFPTQTVDDAVFAAASADNADISSLQLLIERAGTKLSSDGRARAIRNATESHLSDPKTNKKIPAGPAIRFLVDEAGFDLNVPVTECGHTILDLAELATENFRDEPLIQFLKSRGARHGTCWAGSSSV